MSSSIYLRCTGANKVSKKTKVVSFEVMWNDLPIGSLLGKHISLSYYDKKKNISERSYSIIEHSEENNTFDIAVSRAGRGGVSDCINDDISVGAVIHSGGIYGSITPRSLREKSNILLISGGIGLTLPLALIRGLVDEYKKHGKSSNVTLVVCTRDFDDIPFLNELLLFNHTYDWLRVVLFISSGNQSSESDFIKAGRLSESSLGEVCPHKPDVSVVCGSGRFSANMQAILHTLFPSSEIVIEPFSAASDESKHSISVKSNVTEPVKVEVTDKHGNIVNISTGSGEQILDLLEENDVGIRAKCRSGICGSCRILVKSGTIQRGMEFALSQKEISQGVALACCARINSHHTSISV